jgi:hypothetical protein|tara:strand:- start:184 stop:1071 length:888 start_codon:yes stop_codon:yes gene_type:complete
MAKLKLNRTQSTFSKDPVINRAEQVRRDTDTIKTPSCTIYDVDYAIISYIRDTIKPQVEEQGNLIDIPIQYANGEKWSMVQKHGYMRDAKGRLMAPLMTLKRNSITERDILKKLDVNRNPSGNAMVLQNKFTQANSYDRFGVLTNAKPTKEFYITSVPEFVEISYELLIWTSFTEQMNSLIEQIMPTGGFAWGTTWKFNTFIDDYSFETMNNTGEDRVVRATLPLRTKATLLMEDELRVSTVQKRFSTKQIKFGAEHESDVFTATFTPPPTGNYNPIASENELISTIEKSLENRI